MKKYRNIIKLSNLLLDALYKLKTARLQKIQASLEDFSHKCSDMYVFSKNETKSHLN